MFNIKSRISLLTFILITLISGIVLAVEKISIPELVRKCGPAVVMVFNQDGNSITGMGSGFIIDSKGIIVTNYHVVKNATVINVKLVTGETYRVIKIVNLDKEKDICLLKIEGFELPSLVLGNSNKISTGENCITIGNPQGFENTVSNGIISGRRLNNGVNLIQTTAPISPGSSGGPLLNEEGEAIGITSLTWSEPGAQNINFAVPINCVQGMLDSDMSFTFNDLKETDLVKNKNKVSGTETTEKNRYNLITSNDSYKIWFDTQTIKYLYDTKNKVKYIDVWLIWEYTDKGISEIIKARQIGLLFQYKWKKLSHQMEHDLLALNRKMCFLEYTYYTKEGSVLDSYKYTTYKWNEPVPNSIGEFIYEKVSSYAESNLEIEEI